MEIPSPPPSLPPPLPLPPPQITNLRRLLDENTYEIEYEIIGKYDSTIHYNYYDFNPGTTPDIKYECYNAMIDFFLLDVKTFIVEHVICERLHKLFTHPTERLTGKMANNQLVASYIVLDFTVFCMRWAHSVITSQDDGIVTKQNKQNKQNNLDKLISGLNGFDNGYTFITSTLSQLFYYTRDPSSPTGLIKEYKLVTRVLSSCISIQRNLAQVGIKSQLYTFACNRIVTLYIERILNPSSKLTYTEDFTEDREPWKDSVMNRSEPGIRMMTMKKLHARNKYMMPLLELLTKSKPAWRGGGSNSIYSRRHFRTRRRHTTHRRRRRRATRTRRN
jgi:hypothetical protein